MSSEYNNKTVGATSCNYATLQSYNNTQGMHPEVPAGFVPGSMVPVFPTFGSVGYSTLQHGQKEKSCSGYFGIGAAYGQGAMSCDTKYVHNLCTK